MEHVRAVAMFDYQTISLKKGLSENVVYPFLPNGFADQIIPIKWL